MKTIDFGKAIQDAKGASFEALPIGDYDVEVHKTEAVTSSNGKPMIKTTMRVISGPYEKRPIMTQFVLSLDNPQAVAIFFRHMKAFGLDEQYFAALGQVQSLEPVATALNGRRARINVGHREWQGEMRNEVKAVKPYTGAPPAGGPMGPGGPTAPGGFVPNGPALPPTPATPIAAPQQVAPAPAPAPVAAPAPVPPPAPTAPPQVQPMPQPPVPEAAPVAQGVAVPEAVPYPTEATSSEGAAPQPSPSTDATSDPAAPPQLPF